MNKKIIIVLVSILIIIGLLVAILYHFITKDAKDINSTNNTNVTISSDEKYIATIYYNYELGMDASRGYNIFIYKDKNGYKYEIKYGNTTVAGPTVMETKGYGKIFTSNDIENLNKSFENKKEKDEIFSIKYQIMSQENVFKYCGLAELNNYLFKW